MTVSEMSKKLELTQVSGEGGMCRIVEGAYIGDILSVVMSNLPRNSVWVTVLGHINVIAVASLNEASAVILAEGTELDKDAADKADEEGIPVFVSDKPAYILAKELAAINI